MSDNSYNPFERNEKPSQTKRGIEIPIPIELIKAGVFAKLNFKLPEQFHVNFVDRKSLGRFLTSEGYTQSWDGANSDSGSTSGLTFAVPLVSSEGGLTLACNYGLRDLNVVSKEKVLRQEIAELFVRWGVFVQAAFGISDVNFDVQFVPETHHWVDVLEGPPQTFLLGKNIREHIKTYALRGVVVRNGRFGLVVPVAFSARNNLMLLGEASLEGLENPYDLVKRLAAEPLSVTATAP